MSHFAKTVSFSAQITTTLLPSYDYSTNTHNSFDVWSFLIEDKVLRNIGKTIIECECALIEIIGISYSFLELKRNVFFNCYATLF